MNKMNLTNQQIQQSEALYLEMALDTIRLDAITNKVKAVRAVVKETNAKNTQPAQAIVRTMRPYQVALRIAAAVVLILGSASIYKYSTVNTQTLYNQQYAGYELATKRGVSIADAQTDAYRNRDWNQVIVLNSETTSTTNKSRFLAAMAKMELKQFPQALALLETILANKSDESFRDEAEYYMALAYLGNHEGQKAAGITAQIKANPNHTYYPLVAEMSDIDLKIIELKKN